MRTVSTHFGARENNLKSEMRFDLLAQALQGLAEELFHFAAGEANDVRMLLLAPRLVIVLFAGLMHEIEFVNQTAFLQQLQCPVNRDAIQLRIFFLRELEQTLRVQVLPGFIDEIEQDLPLPREAHAALGESVPG